MKNKVIGIDLGTTNSVVSVSEGGEVKVIASKEGKNTTPSVVAFTKDGKTITGETAKRQSVTNAEKTFYSTKRFIGQKYKDIKQEIKNYPYKITEKNNGDVEFSVDDKKVSPEEIASKVLIALKESAENYLGSTVKEAVITVPAYFNDHERQATKDAGAIAGLNVLRIINEPTAAALAYGAEKKKNGTIAIFDFGGGTFDISILEVTDGVIEVKSTNGDTKLGGDDVDQKIITYLMDLFKSETGIDLSQDKIAIQRLKEAAEKAKIELSNVLETDINLPFISADSTGPKHLVTKLSRAKLESLCAKIFEDLLNPCKTAIEDAKIKKSEISEVILVGGSTRIPKVQEIVKTFFEKEPNKSVNPDEVVAIGAAIQGGILAGDTNHNVLLLDVTPLSLGIEVEGGIFAKIIEKNTSIPTKKSQVFSTAENNQPAVTIRVFQGEREIASENKLLGEFNLNGIPAAPRGVPQIEVSFDIDTNGIVHVSAKEKKTNVEQKITITNSSGLSKEEIERMIKEAEENKESDLKKKELIEKKHQCENLTYEIEKQLEENKEFISDEVKEETNKAVEETKTELAKSDVTVEKIKEKTEALYAIFQKVMEEVKKNKPEKKEDNNEGENNTSQEPDEIIDSKEEGKKD
jgi:molecular chaperone DnaK